MTVADDVGAELGRRGIREPQNLKSMNDTDAVRFVQLRDWWSAVPETTRTLLTGIMHSDSATPNTFSEVLLGGKRGLLPSDQTALADYFDAVVAGLGARGELPRIIVNDPVLVFDPPEPAAGQVFVVRWAERNEGGPSRGYKDDFAVRPLRGGSGFQQMITVESLDAGATKDHAIEVPGQAAGTYDVLILVNDPGSDMSALGSATGHGSGLSGQVVVGGLDQNDDPDLARLDRGVMAVTGALALMPMRVESVAEATTAASALATAARRMVAIAPEASRAALTAAADRLAAVTFGPGTALAAVAAAVTQAFDAATSIQLGQQSAGIRKQAADAEADLADAATKLTSAAEAMAAAG